MRIRKRDRTIREAAYYDGERVGERGGDGKVIDRTCPEWFPALAREWNGVSNVTVSMGDLLVKPNGEMIWHSPNGPLRIEPGWWIVKNGSEFLSASPLYFEDEFEPADIANVRDDGEESR